MPRVWRVSRSLRADLADWQEVFAGIAMGIDPIAPPRAVKSALEARLFAELRQPFWSRLGLWRGLTAVAGAVAVAFAILYFQPTGQPAGPLHVAEIDAEDGTLTVVALYDAKTGLLTLNRSEGGAADNRALQLWLIAGDNAPVSLGVLPAERRSTHAIPVDLRRAFAGAVLAISDEPAGGSPTGQPTGAVLATGCGDGYLTWWF